MSVFASNVLKLVLFCFAKLETHFITYILFIRNKLHQNQIFIFAKNLLQIELLFKHSILS